jgi:signal transduction histidine kinase
MPELAHGPRYREAMVQTASMQTSSWWTTASRVWVDLALVAACAIPTLAFPFVHGDASLEPIDGVAALLTVALILVRRRFPIPTLAIGIVSAVVVAAIAERPTGLLPTLVVLLFTVAVRYERRVGVIAGTATILAFIAAIAILAPHGFFGPEILAALAWPALAVAGGDVIRNRRIAVDAAEERARRAEESREENARRRVIEERLRIARELHDVVAHRMAVVNVQAGVAAHLLRQQPDEAERALSVVRSSARVVLDELSGILDVLRAPGDPDAPVEPTPSLGDLPQLVESFAAAGLAVAWETSGEPRPMPESVELALYRTVQEALTNAHKHGDGAARLVLVHGEQEVEVVVENQLPTTPVTNGLPVGGYGLIGMRERILASGGRLDAGPPVDGVFRIRAHLPTGRTGQTRIDS